MVFVNPLKFAYLQCRMSYRMGAFLLLKAGGYDEFQARSLVDNHPILRMTDDDQAFEERKAQRLMEKDARKLHKRA
jgi:hypothetical protein